MYTITFCFIDGGAGTGSAVGVTEFKGTSFRLGSCKDKIGVLAFATWESEMISESRKWIVDGIPSLIIHLNTRSKFIGMKKIIAELDRERQCVYCCCVSKQHSIEGLEIKL